MKLTDAMFQPADLNDKSHGIGYWCKIPSRKTAKLLNAILAGIGTGLACLFWPDYAKQRFLER